MNKTPHLLGQKFPVRSFHVETSLDLAAPQAGLCVMGRAHAALILRVGAVGFEVVYLIDGEEKQVVAVNDSRVLFRVDVAEGALCQFSWKTDGGEWQAVEPAFQAREGHWIGARVELFCGGESGHADFDYFRFSGV